MQLELPEANIANKNTKLKENESKKLIEKVTDLKVEKENLQKQIKQLEKQLQGKSSKVQPPGSTDMMEMTVQKLQAAWEGVKYNLQNIPQIASYMVRLLVIVEFVITRVQHRRLVEEVMSQNTLAHQEKIQHIYLSWRIFAMTSNT